MENSTEIMVTSIFSKWLFILKYYKIITLLQNNYINNFDDGNLENSGE